MRATKTPRCRPSRQGLSFAFHIRDWQDWVRTSGRDKGRGQISRQKLYIFQKPVTVLFLQLAAGMCICAGHAFATIRLRSVRGWALDRHKPAAQSHKKESDDLRRSLEWIAPFFLIALLGQFFAPVAAGFAVARLPQADWPICTQNSGLPQAPADRGHHSRDCCTFCAQAHATFALSASPQVLGAVTSRTDMRASLWVCAAPRAQPVGAAKARGPPASPKQSPLSIAASIQIA